MFTQKLAIAFTIMTLSTSAYALDVGIGGGGLGVGGNVGAGGGGLSVGVDAGLDGVGSVDVDASSGPGGTSVGAGADVEGAGGASVGAGVGAGSVGVDAGVSGAGTPAGGTRGGVGANRGTPSGGTATAGAAIGAVNNASAASGQTKGVANAKALGKRTVKAQSALQRAFLPPRLSPEGSGERVFRRTLFGYPSRPMFGLQLKQGVAPAIVDTCRSAISAAANPLGAMRVEALSAGVSTRKGKLVLAPLNVRIQYARAGGVETRQAKVTCQVNSNGNVVAVK